MNNLKTENKSNGTFVPNNDTDNLYRKECLRKLLVESIYERTVQMIQSCNLKHECIIKSLSKDMEAFSVESTGTTLSANVPNFITEKGDVKIYDYIVTEEKHIAFACYIMVEENDSRINPNIFQGYETEGKLFTNDMEHAQLSIYRKNN